MRGKLARMLVGGCSVKVHARDHRPLIYSWACVRGVTATAETAATTVTDPAVAAVTYPAVTTATAVTPLLLPRCPPPPPAPRPLPFQPRHRVQTQEQHHIGVAGGLWGGEWQVSGGPQMPAPPDSPWGSPPTGSNTRPALAASRR